MRVLDLFSGTGGASQAFLDRGHDVVRIDNDPQFSDVPNTIIDDVRNEIYSPAQSGAFDVVWASPPCQAFSLAATGTHMTAFSVCGCGLKLFKNHERWEHVAIGSRCVSPKPISGVWLEPKTEFGKLSVRLIERTLELINIIKPKFWWMENPNGGMIHFVPGDIPRVQITQCQYGEPRQKLTNLWGDWPDTWHPRLRCKNGDPCHTAAPRGAKTGTQGIKGAVARAKVPYELSLEVCLATEAAG